MSATVRWVAKLAWKILCNRVQALLAQAPDVVIAVRTATCKSLEDDPEGIALCTTATCGSGSCKPGWDPSPARDQDR